MPELVDPQYLGVLVFAGAVLGFALGLAADWWVDSRRTSREVVERLRRFAAERPGVRAGDLADILDQQAWQLQINSSRRHRDGVD